MNQSIRWATDRIDAYVDFLRQAVEIETPSRSPECFPPLLDLFQGALESRGASVERMPAPGFGENIIARIPGGGGSPLFILGHMDTVHPVGTLERLPFKVEGDRLSGPGVYDMKGGVATLLFALNLMNTEGRAPSGDILIMLTCDEEVGSYSSRELIEATAKDARAALIIEPCVPGGAAKTRRKGMGGYRINITGKAVHAGIEPEAGASAVHEMARVILQVLELQDVEAGTTLNVGVVEGGSKINVVADDARAKVDLRVWTRAEADRVNKSIQAISVTDSGCTLEIEGGINRYALERTEQSGRLFDDAAAIASELGFSLDEGRSGGASDGNLTAAVGCPTLDGLGPDGGGAHSLEEHLLLSDVPFRIALLSHLLSTV